MKAPIPWPRERWCVTWSTWTEESAAMGDVLAHGFADCRGGRWDADDPGPHEMTLRDALKIAGYPQDSGRWFSSVDPDTDYRTGESTFFCLHPPQNITASSYARVRRILGAK